MKKDSEKESVKKSKTPRKKSVKKTVDAPQEEIRSKEEPNMPRSIIDAIRKNMTSVEPDGGIFIRRDPDTLMTKEMVIKFGGQIAVGGRIPRDPKSGIPKGSVELTLQEYDRIHEIGAISHHRDGTEGMSPYKPLIALVFNDIRSIYVLRKKLEELGERLLGIQCHDDDMDIDNRKGTVDTEDFKDEQAGTGEQVEKVGE